MGFLTAPSRQEVKIALTMYGPVTGLPEIGPAAGKARVWLMPDPGFPQVRTGLLRVAYNALEEPGQPLRYMDLPVTRAVVRTTRTGRSIAVTVPGRPTPVSQIEAPCLCGAGQVGHAGPVNDRHAVVQVRVDELPWYVQA